MLPKEGSVVFIVALFGNIKYGVVPQDCVVQDPQVPSPDAVTDI